MSPESPWRLSWAVRCRCRPSQAFVLECGVTAGESARVAGAQVKDAFGDKQGMKGLVLTDTESGARPSPPRECRLARSPALLAQHGKAWACTCQRARARAHRSATRSCPGHALCAAPQPRACPCSGCLREGLARGPNPSSPLTLPPTRRARAAPGEERKLQVCGLFYGIGHMPNSGIVAGQVELDAAGYVKVPPPLLPYSNPNPALPSPVPSQGAPPPPIRGCGAACRRQRALARLLPPGRAGCPRRARRRPRGCGAARRCHRCVPAPARPGRPTRRLGRARAQVHNRRACAPASIWRAGRRGVVG
jgi:hypothetical protein